MSSPLCPSVVHVEGTARAVGGTQGLSRLEELLAGILEELRYMRALQEDVAREQREFKDKYERAMMPTPEQRAKIGMETLVQLCAERDQLRSQLDAIELIASENAENGTGFDKVIRLQVEASGIPQRIAQLEQQISMVQQSLEAESLNSANETAAADPGAPEAK